MDDYAADGAAGVLHLDATAFPLKEAFVAYLTAAFGVEGRPVKDNFDFLAFLWRTGLPLCLREMMPRSLAQFLSPEF